jgi:hypothetical protein
MATNSWVSAVKSWASLYEVPVYTAQESPTNITGYQVEFTDILAYSVAIYQCINWNLHPTQQTWQFEGLGRFILSRADYQIFRARWSYPDAHLLDDN